MLWETGIGIKPDQLTLTPHIRVLDINGANMDHVRSVQDATALLNQSHDTLSITLQKNSTSYGPLSSSSR